MVIESNCMLKCFLRLKLKIKQSIQQEAKKIDFLFCEKSSD